MKLEKGLELTRMKVRGMTRHRVPARSILPKLLAVHSKLVEGPSVLAAHRVLPHPHLLRRQTRSEIREGVLHIPAQRRQEDTAILD